MPVRRSMGREFSVERSKLKVREEERKKNGVAQRALRKSAEFAERLRPRLVGWMVEFAKSGSFALASN